MAENKLATATSVTTVKSLANSPAMVAKFQNVLGKKAPQFLASVVSATNANSLLKNAEPMTVMASAMVAATLDLDVIPGLGFAALVPYNRYDKQTRTSHNECQFQIMTKGLIQLAMRSGQYRTINAGPIYEDEYDGLDMITGELHYHEVPGGFRDQAKEDKIVGYFAFFETLNGFRKIEYWPMSKIIAHGRRYSKSYDSGPWKTNFHAMARKTVLKATLSQWGILSTQMQTAISADQAVFHSVDEQVPEYDDNPESAKHAEQASSSVDAFAQEVSQEEGK